MAQRSSFAFSTKYAADMQRRASIGKHMKLISGESNFTLVSWSHSMKQTRGILHLVAYNLEGSAAPYKNYYSFLKHLFSVANTAHNCLQNNTLKCQNITEVVACFIRNCRPVR
jgi:hypothetical protein